MRRLDLEGRWANPLALAPLLSATHSPGMLDLIVCPACASGLAQRDATLTCRGCGATYALEGGIFALLPPGTQDTRLDLATYLKLAVTTPDAVRNVAEQFRHVLAVVGKGLDGTMLEIGAGTGLLTEAMARHGGFERIVSTDVSLAFLRHTRDRLAELPVSFLACDGNTLPLRDGAFDVVLGRSVLHHLLHYRETLRRVHDLLRPGGVTVWFEPVQAGKAMIAFLFRIMLELDTATGALGLTEHEKSRMTAALKGLMKPVSVEGVDLSRLEDKFNFAIDGLCTEALELGYATARYVNVPNVDRTYFGYLSMHLRSFGVRPEIVSRVAWLKQAFGDTLGAMAGPGMTAPMGYFVFGKAAAERMRGWV